jgi:hypothetical protein
VKYNFFVGEDRLPDKPVRKIEEYSQFVVFDWPAAFETEQHAV